MLSTRASITFALAALLVASPVFATRTHKPAVVAHSKSGHKLAARSKGKAKIHKLHGQLTIDAARVGQIQQALIREHYMTGESSGEWDATTQAAMLKYQADHGWQTRLSPDSRALKTLGLGPDYSNAINARDSSFAPPAPASTIPAEQASGFAAAAGVNR